MRSQRIILLLISFLLVGGSMGLTAGYGLYYRSESYRREVEADLTAFFELPCDVGRIRPRSFDTRAFQRVAIWLPDWRDQVFFCEEALWRETEPEGGPLTRELELINGKLILGTDRWHDDDYKQLLESGLGHDFEGLNLTRVVLRDFEVSFERDGLSIRCRDTAGNIDMTDPEEGRADLRAFELNGHRVSQGVQIFALFSPSNGIEIHELVLDLPEVPLSTIGLGSALGSVVSGGRFAGRLEYKSRGSGLQPGSDGPAEAEIRISGDVLDVRLAELTRRLPFGPLEGRLSVNLENARVADGVVTHVRGRGEIAGLSLNSFAPLLDMPALDGTADLNIQWIDLALGHVNRLVVDGQARDLGLHQILQRWGPGSATGKLAIDIHTLRIVQDKIEAADIEIRAIPPDDGPGTISRDLLLGAAKQFVNIEWPSWIPQSIVPDQIEYTEFGVRLLINDNKLRILGTHGTDGKTILTVRILRPIGLVRAPSGSFDLAPWIDALLAKARSYDPDKVRRWLQRQPSGPSPDPSTPPPP